MEASTNAGKDVLFRSSAWKALATCTRADKAVEVSAPGGETVFSGFNVATP